MAVPLSRRYLDWKLKVISCIAEDGRVHWKTRLEEIKCVLRNDGHYPDSYLEGNMPEEAWADEVEAIKDSMRILIPRAALEKLLASAGSKA